MSLADSKIVKQTKLSSLGLFIVRISVNRRTQCGSVRGSENLSTQNHVEYDSPVCGGKIRSPVGKKFFFFGY